MLSSISWFFASISLSASWAFFRPGDVHKGDHCAFDNVLESAIGQDAHRIPLSRPALHFHFFRH